MKLLLMDHQFAFLTNGMFLDDDVAVITTSTIIANADDQVFFRS
jgi:hypothetical protein